MSGCRSSQPIDKGFKQKQQNRPSTRGSSIPVTYVWRTRGRAGYWIGRRDRSGYSGRRPVGPSTSSRREGRRHPPLRPERAVLRAVARPAHLAHLDSAMRQLRCRIFGRYPARPFRPRDRASPGGPVAVASPMAKAPQASRNQPTSAQLCRLCCDTPGWPGPGLGRAVVAPGHPPSVAAARFLAEDDRSVAALGGGRQGRKHHYVNKPQRTQQLHEFHGDDC